MARRHARPLRLFALCSLGLWLGGAQAQAGIVVTPSRISVPSTAPAKLTGAFRVENPDAAPVTVTVEPEDWSNTGQGARRRAAWVQVAPQQFTVPPGGHVVVRYTVRVPRHTTGELRAQVFFTTDNAPEGGIVIRNRLGAALYVAIKGSARIQAAITDVRATYTAATPGVPQPDRLELSVRIRNSGNAHAMPAGRVAVLSEAGALVGELPLVKPWSVLPGAEETYTLTRQGIHLPPGRYLLRVEITCGADIGQPVTLETERAAVVGEDGQLTLPSVPPAS